MTAERQQLEERARRGDFEAILRLKRIREDEAMSVRGMPFVRDEVRAQGEDCSSGDALSHNEYRAAIVKQAVKNAAGKKPETKHFFAAKLAVDREIGKSGTSIFIPGAKPGRRTV